METETEGRWRSPVHLAWPALLALVAVAQMALADTTVRLLLGAVLLICAIGMGYEAVRPRRRRQSSRRRDD